ncbi:hypothetical protein DLAC_11165 [Tieghemostelium lacteum]|uniref:Kri1-like C-terminal domain-containing protein n=1 Tax=Tieghemostelium lacteum TaxID=361077 RepID=A0A151Z3G2_TIELA|nr:hypothetical protein DLAC_11165 [Tieghemostelium lacteum]|eukprot:KYQ88457.1 hypothetical protein DLAC_11165 [Tieghemostelium lacteum]
MSKLLSDDEGSIGSSGEDEIKVNNDFAKKYDQRKKNEAVTSSKTSDEEDEMSEDDEGKLDSDKWNDDFLTLLPMLTNKNKKLYDKSTVFFNKNVDESESDQDSKPSSKSKKSKEKEKSLTLKEYQRNKILKTMDKEQYEEEDEDNVEDFESLPHVKQQEKLKKDFLKQANKKSKESDGSDSEDDSDSDSDMDNFLKKRVKSKEVEEQEEKEFQEFKDKFDSLKKQSGIDEDEGVNSIESFWKSKDIPDDEKFLRDYIVGQKWQSDKGKLPSYEEIMKELEADEGEVNKQDDFERVYNFRYEEPGAAVIVGNPRNITDSLRRKDSKRKEQRDKLKDKKGTDKVRKDEQIKKLKNEKKKEILEKVKEINEITGSKIFNLDSVDIRKLDPEVMVKSVGKKKKTKQQQDEEEAYQNDQEDMGEEYYGDNVDINELIANSGYLQEDFESDDDEVWTDDRISQEKRELEEMLDKYYGIDYQDMIDDIPVRFQYTTVDKDDNNIITIDDILEKDDKELEKIQPLSKISAYGSSHKKADKRYWDHNSKYHTWSSKTFKPKSTSDVNTKKKNNNYNNNNNNNYDYKQNNNFNHLPNNDEKQQQQFNSKDKPNNTKKFNYNNDNNYNNKNNQNGNITNNNNNKRKFDDINYEKSYEKEASNNEEKVIKKRKSKNKNLINK